MKRAAIFIAALICTARADAEPLLTEAQWIADGADAVTLLSTRPVEIESDDFTVRLGRIAFRSPHLLGGVAAKRGLTCATCHPGGGRNAAFFLAPLSNAPGTVDVSNALFGPDAENGIDDPKSIPPLYGIRSKSAFPSDRRFASLDRFVHHVIEAEFAGDTPPEPLFRALIAYLDFLPPRNAPVPRTPLTFEREFAEALADVDVLSRSEGPTASFVRKSVRAHLGRIAERFADIPGAYALLVELSVMLKDAQTPEELAHWRETAVEYESLLSDFVPDSLYNPAVLTGSLDRAPNQ